MKTEQGNQNLFFFDIEIKDEERRGLELAAEIRQMDPTAVIVFVTTHSEFAPISYRYKVSALDFIDKTISDNQFEDQIKDCIFYAKEMLSNIDTDEMFVFETAKSNLRLPLRNILYFETSATPHKVCMWTLTERMEFYGNLSEIQEVSPQLYQCHRSFLINLKNVVRIDKLNRLVYFENGDSCLVSRLKMKSLIEKWEKLQ